MKRFIYIFIIFIFSIALSSCSQDDILSMLDNVVESDNFVIHYNESDKYCVEQVKNQLEVNSKRINNYLFCEGQSKIDVYIYPDIKSFHYVSYGYFVGFFIPQYIVANSDHGYIELVSPLNPGDAKKYNDVMDALVEKYTQLVLYSLNPKLPFFINNGMSLYLAIECEKI